MKHRNGHLPRCQEFTGWCRRTETRQPRQQKEFKFYKNQNLSGKLSKKRKQALAQAVTELLHASGLQYTQVAKIENRDQTKEQQKRRFFGWRAFFKLAAARPQELVGKVIGRGVFNRSPFSSLPCYWSSIFDQSLLSSIFFSPFSQFHLKRRAALSWIREHGSDEGVVYFADDDNSYDTRIFEEIRKTRWLQICFFYPVPDEVMSIWRVDLMLSLICWVRQWTVILKGCVSVPGGPRPQVRGEFSDLEGRKGHRLLWCIPGWP